MALIWNIKFSTALFWAVIVCLIVLSFFILEPFIIPLVSAFVLAYLIKPIYSKLEKISNKHLAAAISIILAIGIIIVPIILVSSALISQAQSSLNVPELRTTLDEKISSLVFLDNLNLDIANIKEKALSFLISIITKTISQIPILLLSLAITLLATYYMLIKWDVLVVKIKEFLPFRNKEELTNSIAKTTRYIIYGYFLLALVEFLVASIGFYFAGISSFFLLPLLLAMTAFIPGIGPALIWVPTFIIQIISGNYVSAIIILCTGLIISVLIETLLFSKLMGDKASIHPLVMLMGILGGIPLFGIFGFIIGPLVLAYTIRILEQSLKNK